MPFILACYMQIDADPNPAIHFVADPSFQINADPDPQHWFLEDKKRENYCYF
jgi:hypothetical protein